MLAKSVVLTYLNNGRQISILEGKLISAKVISYHFWSNRARTLHSHHLLLHWLFPLRVGNLSTLPRGHAFTPGQIRWSTGPSLLPFPFCLLSPRHMLFLLSDFIQGKPFLGKNTYFLNHNQSDFLRCTPQKISHLLVQTPSQLDNHIFSRHKHTHLTEILMALSFD